MYGNADVNPMQVRAISSDAGMGTVIRRWSGTKYCSRKSLEKVSLWVQQTNWAPMRWFLPRMMSLGTSVVVLDYS